MKPQPLNYLLCTAKLHVFTTLNIPIYVYIHIYIYLVQPISYNPYYGNPYKRTLNVGKLPCIHIHICIYIYIHTHTGFSV